MLGKPDIHMQKKKISPLSLTMYKNKLQWIKVIHVRPQTEASRRKQREIL
jgi:hypothetical protein